MSATAGVWGRSWVDADDATLLEHVRGGDSEAYAELWRRHLPAAYSVAHRYRGRAAAEDIVGEASLRVYDLIRAGKGPTSNFRSYFLTSVKTVAVDLARTELRVVPSEHQGLESAAPPVAAYDAAGRVDQDLVRNAFRRLPERDQRVLWHTAVEGTSPAVVATTMGMTANGVSVAALRAKDTLRARYLDAHADRAIGRAEDEECRWVLSQMGRYVRGKLPVRQKARVERHLQDCPHAQALLIEMAEVNRGLPALMVPLIFVAGTGTAAAWVGAGLAGASGAHATQDPTTLMVGGAGATTAGLVAKTAAVVAAGALGAGFVAAPSDGFELFRSNDRAAVVAGGSGGGSDAGSGGGGGGDAGLPVSPGDATSTAAATADPTALPTSTEAVTTLPEATAPVLALDVDPSSLPTDSVVTTTTTVTEPEASSAPSLTTPPTPSTEPPLSSSTTTTSSSSTSTTSTTTTSTTTTSSSSTSTTTSNTITKSTTGTLTTAPKPTVRGPGQVRNYLPFLLRYDTGANLRGTLTITIDNGVVQVPACLARPSATVSCQVSGRSGTRLVIPVARRAATVTITLRNATGMSTSMQVAVRVP